MADDPRVTAKVVGDVLEGRDLAASIFEAAYRHEEVTSYFEMVLGHAIALLPPAQRLQLHGIWAKLELDTQADEDSARAEAAAEAHMDRGSRSAQPQAARGPRN